jgi:hypothetical protein
LGYFSESGAIVGANEGIQSIPAVKIALLITYLDLHLLELFLQRSVALPLNV